MSNATCGCVKRRLDYFMLYVPKHITLFAASSGPSLVRDGSLGTHPFVRFAHYNTAGYPGQDIHNFVVLI